MGDPNDGFGGTLQPGGAGRLKQVDNHQLVKDMDSEQTSNPAPLFEMRGIHKAFGSRRLFAPPRKVVAAEDISFRINRGEIVALVGESGSGKSTIARLILRLDRPDGGEMHLNGRDVLSEEPRYASLAYRGRVQMVFQDPFGSLNRVHTIGYHVIRPLLRHRRCTKSEARTRATALLRTVGLEPAEEFIDRHPYELSGGQRQRVAIARALAAEPQLLVADEPTSMLDVSIRMGVLTLLQELRSERGLAILLITHDLASARYLADRILVLFCGRVVEDGPGDAIVGSPKHPYTQALVASTAGTNPILPAEGRRERTTSAALEGCPFAARCPEVHDLCHESDPMPRVVDGRHVRCHLYPNN
jgi:oligopeptide/dipeptide ABC transporter ATP-binding protein